MQPRKQFASNERKEVYGGGFQALTRQPSGAAF